MRSNDAHRGQHGLCCVEVYVVNWAAINPVFMLVLRPVCCLLLIILYLILTYLLTYSMEQGPS